MKKQIQLILGLSLISLSVFAQIPTSGLVAYFPFNGNANDESGNGNNSTYIGTGVTLTSDRFGNANKAYSFDGNTGSHIRFPADNFPTGNRTISLWFYVTHVDNHPGVLCYGGNGGCNTQILMIINKADFPNAYTVLAHCATNLISAPYSEEPVNKWYQLTMTINGSEQKIYINGVLKQTANTFLTSTFVAGTSTILGEMLNTDGNSIYIDNSAGKFVGKLDDLRFYNVAMDETQVLALYNSESVTVNITENTFTRKIIVSPNPTAGNVRIDLGSDFRNVKVLIHDINGRLIKSDEYYGGQVFNLNLSEPSGIYIATIISGSKTAVLRIIKN
jgi:hypothetical protein